MSLISEKNNKPIKRNAVTAKKVATTPEDGAALANLAAAKLEQMDGLHCQIDNVKNLRDAARFVLAAPGQARIPKPYDGSADWLAYINRMVNLSLSAEQRQAVMAALRTRRSRKRRKLASLEIKGETLDRLQSWQASHGHASLDAAIAALMDMAEPSTTDATK
ncbi:hypothetical protein [Chromobacterium sp. ATCC 53434]|uniref:hypothetical protein n=1 Tax=Chromobacterium sp. (strain ATCC 53434 / SC 14030) TaxID=2059672 RepID=UPI00130513E2|nr:hypothetical protein [Chromobacterium sp. ATCC 53434]